MQSISFPTMPPRDTSTLEGFRLTRGLGPHYFTAAAAGSFTILIAVSLFIPPREVSLILFKGLAFLALSCLSAGYTRFVYRKRRARFLAFRHGTLSSGIVLSISRVFVPWKSARDYRFEVDAGGCGSSTVKVYFQTWDRTVSEEYHPGSRIEFFHDARSDSFFFPAEAGYRSLEIQARPR